MCVFVWVGVCVGSIGVCMCVFGWVGGWMHTCIHAYVCVGGYWKRMYMTSHVTTPTLCHGWCLCTHVLRVYSHC